MPWYPECHSDTAGKAPPRGVRTSNELLLLISDSSSVFLIAAELCAVLVEFVADDDDDDGVGALVRVADAMRSAKELALAAGLCAYDEAALV